VLAKGYSPGSPTWNRSTAAPNPNQTTNETLYTAAHQPASGRTDHTTHTTYW